MKIAIQGIEGSFHHVATRDYFKDPDVDIVECPNFKSSIARLISGHADVAVMAIENSIAGSILPNYNLLQNRSIKVVGEIDLLIKHNLLVLPQTQIQDIQEIHSHPMALLQCDDFIDSHPSWRQVSSQDTAFSARNVSQNKLKNTAAIAGDLPAQLWGLKILESQINTIKNNYTRFLIIVRAEDSSLQPTVINKASLYFKLNHQHGSLNRVLKSMELYEMNMTKLQSYPIPSDPFRYLFHVDMEFQNTDQYRAAIELMSHHSQELHVYGEYDKYRL